MKCVISGIMALLIFTMAAEAQAADVIETVTVPQPKPLYEVSKERSVMIPMRDGTKQSANIYFPVNAGKKLPVILMRTPYGKDVKIKPYEERYKFLAEQGFVFVISDVRGRHESQGEFMPQLGDVDDGYDTIEWLGKQPWSNGKVGMIGCSYMGDVQILVAQSRPPALKALLPQAAGSSIGSAGGQYKYFAARRGGAIVFAQNVGWFYNNGAKVFYGPSRELSRDEFLANVEFFKTAPALPEPNFPALWRHLPINDIMRFANVPANDFNDLATRKLDDPWWDQFHYMDDDYQADAPALHMNSWHDFGARETIYEFEVMSKTSLSKTARDNQFLLISPTAHCRSEASTSATVVGERDMGDARFDYWTIYAKWFDYWLRDNKNDTIKNLPKVTYYLMGKNEWKTASAWPIPGAVPTKFYLHSKGRANGRYGDGALSTEPPANQTADSYTYDPGNPVPSKGGPMCCTGVEPSAGSFDQREIEMRNDVLVYTSEPLKEGIEVTGVIDVVLYVSSDAKDTDFVVKLVDVYPDGRAYNLTEGILRARYRDGQTKQVFMEPNKVYKVTVDANATSNYFAPGHRLRLEVSSSNFPLYDRNLNTGGNNYDETAWVVARNSVHHAKLHASHIILPVVQATGGAKK